MKIAIGLPNAVPHTVGLDLVAWTRDVEELTAIGVDEAFFWPMNADRRQVERLAQATR